MSALKFKGLVVQSSILEPEKEYRKQLDDKIFKKRLVYTDISDLKRNLLFHRNEFNTNNVRICFAVLQTNNGLFNLKSKRYAILLAKDKKDLWTVPIFTLSKEYFPSMDEMLKQMFIKVLPIMKRLYDVKQFEDDQVFITRIDQKYPTYIYIIPPNAWGGSAKEVQVPLNSKYVDLGWFDQHTYKEDPEYWKDEFFGNETSVVIKYVNNFFDNRVGFFSGNETQEEE
jgi:hypothetical protein